MHTYFSTSECQKKTLCFKYMHPNRKILFYLSKKLLIICKVDRKMENCFYKKSKLSLVVLQWRNTGQSNRMLAGMQRLGVARRYSRVKRAVENRKAGKGKHFAFKIFRDRVRERLPFLRGNPKGAFLPLWRMEG